MQLAYYLFYFLRRTKLNFAVLIINSKSLLQLNLEIKFIFQQYVKDKEKDKKAIRRKEEKNNKKMIQYNYNYRYALLVVSVFGYLCCPDRSDFNVPLGVFSFILWSDQQFSHKHRIIYLLLISLIGDALWIIFIGFIKWSTDEHVTEAAKSMHQLTRIVSILNVVYKIGLVIYATNKIESCRHLFNRDTISTQISGEK